MTEAAYGHLAEGERSLLAATRRLAAETLAPIAERGEPGRVNRPLLLALAEHGLLGRLFDRGEGTPQTPQVSTLELCLIREGLAIACTEAETAFALQGLGALPIALAGRAELVERWITAVARGEAVAAFALTEPGAGSDAAALSVRAERDGEEWTLRGEKAFISNAPEADVYTVFARTGGEGPGGITAFAVPGDADGVGGEPTALLAPHPIGTLALDGVRVPDGARLGEPGTGFKLAMRTLDAFRPSVGAFSVGMAQAAVEEATSHAGAREAFGGRLRDFQAVSHQLAEMATRTQAARLLVHAAARATDSAADGRRQLVAMSKLFATESAQFVVDAAVQILGARALQRGHPLEHLYREVRAPRIYEGTSEIQREIIARELYR